MSNPGYVVDDFPYYLGKDQDGTKTNIKNIHGIVFSIMLEIDRICRKNNIPYALAFGSALGLYNYQGFIPWDDDADFAVDYFDIQRLKEAFDKDLGADFDYICYEKDERWNVLIPTFKVKKRVGYMQDRNYKLIPDRTNSYEGFFVDIVAFMGMKNAKEHKKIIHRSQRRLVRYFISDYMFNHDPLRLKHKIKEEEKVLAELYKDAPYVCQSPIIPFQTPKINLYPREVIYPFKEYLFNGHKLYSFNDVETFCKMRYGEKSLKQLENGQLVDKLPQKERKALHVRKFHLPK